MDKKETDGKYNRRAHSVCCLTYHAVFVIKYRRKVIDDEIMEFMKNHTRYLIEDRFKGKMLEFNGEDIEDYMAREVLPHIPDDKWFFEENLAAKKPVIKTGAEIPFTRCFYKYQKQTASEDIAARMAALVKEAGEIEKKLFG